MLVKGSVRTGLVLLLGLPAGAYALGLGDIHLLSPLDAPLDAEVELVDVSPDELNSLQAQIASRETFSRYGLDYPAYLTGVTAHTVHTPDGRQVIQLKSTEPIHQAYLTLLIELNWARGRLVREYTMLLDPPVYTPAQQGTVAGAPVAAPATGLETREGAIAREAPPPPAAPPGRPLPAQAAALPPPEITPPAPPPPRPLAGDTTPGPAAAARATPPAPRAPEPPAARTPPPPAPTPPAAAMAKAKPKAAPVRDDHVVQSGESLSQIAGAVSGAAVTSAQTQTWMLAIYRANPQAFDRSNMNVLRSGSVLRMPEDSDVASITPAEASEEIHRQYVAWRNDAGAAKSEPSGSDGAPATARAGRGSLKLVIPTGEGAEGGEDSPEGIKAQKGGDGEGAGGAPASGSDSERLLQMRDSQLATMQSRLASEQNGEVPAAGESAPAASSSAPSGMAVDMAPKTAAADSEQAAPSAAPAVEPPAAAPPQAPALRNRKAYNFLVQVEDLARQLWWIGAAMGLGLVIVIALRLWKSRRQAEFDSLEQLSLATPGGMGPMAAMEHGFASNDGLGMGPLEGSLDESFSLDDLPPERTGRFSAPSARPAVEEEMPELRTTESTMGLSEPGDPLAEADFHIGYGMYDQTIELLQAAIQHEPGRRDLRLKLLEVYFEAGRRDDFLPVAEDLMHSQDQAAPGEWEKIVIMGRQIAPDDPLFAGSEPFGGGVDQGLEGGDGQVDVDLFGGGLRTDVRSFGQEDQGAQGAAADFSFGEDFGPATGQDLANAGMLDAGDLDIHPTHLRVGDQTVEEVEPQFAHVDPTGTHEVMGYAHQEPEELSLDSEEISLDSSDLAGLSSEPQTGDATVVAGFDEHSRRIIESASLRRQPPQPASYLEPEPEEIGTAWETGGLEATPGMDPDLYGQTGVGSSAELEPPYDLDETGNSPLMSYAPTQGLAPEEMALPDLEPVTMSEVGTKLDLARAYVDMGDPEGARNILEEVLSEGSASQKQEAQRLLESLPG